MMLYQNIQNTPIMYYAVRERDQILSCFRLDAITLVVGFCLPHRI